MTMLAHITAKAYLMLSLILAAAFVLSFIGEEGFSADQQGGSMPAKPPSNTQPVVPQEHCPECMPPKCPECMPSKTQKSDTQPVVPQEPPKSQGQGKVLGGVDVKTKTSFDKQGNKILSSDVSSTVKVESLIIKDLEKGLKDYQTGFHKGVADGLALAKKGGSMDDLFKMKKATDVRIIIRTTEMEPIGYDKGLSSGYSIQKSIEPTQKTTSERPK